MKGRENTQRPLVPECETRHASCVAFGGRAVLIEGASGSGKSGLALQLMALGAGLVSDDRTTLWRDGDALMADVPERLDGLIEAREVGILRVRTTGATPVALVVDLDICETDRLPPHRETRILDCVIPVLRKSELPHFPAAILTYLRGQREA
ncbi:MAG: HPr kinase/phosphatase C-terminal domain-containing protein [Pseudomonadota bacterium]